MAQISRHLENLRFCVKKISEITPELLTRVHQNSIGDVKKNDGPTGDGTLGIVKFHRTKLPMECGHDPIYTHREICNLLQTSDWKTTT